MSFKTIYDENSFTACEDDKITEIYKQYAKSFILNGGMDVTKLETMFDKFYKPKKFFKLKTDYGLIAYNLSKHEPAIKIKKELKDNLKDYVLASAACYPAFKPRKINGDLFIDGGYYDNLPINLAIKLGAEEIIAVDLRAVGLTKEVSGKADITIITPKNKIINFLVFDKAKIREAINFGYNDTMKTFHKLDGNKFTFKKGNLVKNYNKYAEDFKIKLHDLFSNIDNSVLKIILSSNIFNEFLDSKVSYLKFNELVEKCGFCFNFSEDNIYNIKTYNKGLFKLLLETETINKDEIIKNIKKRELKKIIDTRAVVKYFYKAIEKNSLTGVVKYLPIFADEFLIALYIYIVKGKRKVY